MKIYKLETEKRTKESESDGEEFYNYLYRKNRKVPHYNLKILLADANVKIGKGNIYQRTVINCSLHDETSENGRLLNDSAQEN